MASLLSKTRKNRTYKSRTCKNKKYKTRKSNSKKNGGGLTFSKPKSRTKENTNSKLETNTPRKQVIFRKEPVSDIWSQSPRNSDEFYIYDTSETKTLRDALRDEADEKKVKEKYIDKYIDLKLFFAQQITTENISIYNYQNERLNKNKIKQNGKN